MPMSPSSYESDDWLRRYQGVGSPRISSEDIYVDLFPPRSVPDRERKGGDETCPEEFQGSASTSAPQYAHKGAFDSSASFA